MRWEQAVYVAGPARVRACPGSGNTKPKRKSFGMSKATSLVGGTICDCFLAFYQIRNGIDFTEPIYKVKSSKIVLVTRKVDGVLVSRLAHWV